MFSCLTAQERMIAAMSNLTCANSQSMSKKLKDFKVPEVFGTKWSASNNILMHSCNNKKHTHQSIHTYPQNNTHPHRTRTHTHTQCPYAHPAVLFRTNYCRECMHYRSGGKIVLHVKTYADIHKYAHTHTHTHTHTPYQF